MKFFKTLLATTLGTIVAFVILAFLGFIIMAAIIASSTSTPEPMISENTVLTIDIDGKLPARNTKNPFEKFLHPKKTTVSLQSLRENLNKAAADKNIEGVLLELSFVSGGWANLQEAHNIIAHFRKSSDKFVYATTDDIGYNEKAYYLATAADSIFSPPHSLFEFNGFYTKVMFYNNLLNKIGVEPEIAKHGQFKSAVEPYYRTNFSDASELQLTELIQNVNNTFMNAVSKKSDVSTDKLNQLLNKKPRLATSFGIEYGLIDSLLYPSELKKLIEKRMGITTNDESYETITNSEYLQISKESAGLTVENYDHEIAVLYASGIIRPHSGNPMFGDREAITANTFKEHLEEIKEDDVEALVIRINSPGGSGSTSDLIWQMVHQTAQHIPVIVSMGPVAASGGYYIASAADTIVAQPTTITGSIGVFSTNFNANQLFNEKLGITFDVVKSHPHADWLSMTRSFTPAEAKAYQQFVDSFYHTFVSKVATSRQMDYNAVDQVAGGRVWSGKAALKKGLVDVLGGLEKALAIAAEKAGIENYDLTTYPKPKSIFELFMNTAQTKTKALVESIFYPNNYMKKVTKPLSLMKKKNMLLLYPYEITIH